MSAPTEPRFHAITDHGDDVDRSGEWDRLRAEHLHEHRPPSSARGVHHLALLSSNVEQTIVLYQDLLEFPLTELFENRDYTGSTHFFDIGNGNLLAFFDFPGLDLGPYAEVLGSMHHLRSRSRPRSRRTSSSCTTPASRSCSSTSPRSTSTGPTANVSNCSPIRSARCTARTSAESPGSPGVRRRTAYSGSEARLMRS